MYARLEAQKVFQQAYQAMFGWKCLFGGIEVGAPF